MACRVFETLGTLSVRLSYLSTTFLHFLNMDTDLGSGTIVTTAILEISASTAHVTIAVWTDTSEPRVLHQQ